MSFSGFSEESEEPSVISTSKHKNNTNRRQKEKLLMAAANQKVFIIPSTCRTFICSTIHMSVKLPRSSLDESLKVPQSPSTLLYFTDIPAVEPVHRVSVW